VALGDQRRYPKEKLWQEFFSDPLQWWDYRLEKVNARYPDFMHKKTREALWLVDRKNPPWVEMEMAAMAPGTVDLNPFLWNRRLSKYVKAGEYEKTLGLFRQMQSKVVSLTCMPNAGAWRMLGVCSPRFPQMMWCLGLPSYSHM